MAGMGGKQTLLSRGQHPRSSGRLCDSHDKREQSQVLFVRDSHLEIAVFPEGLGLGADEPAGVAHCFAFVCGKIRKN
jgi:hypothetical protein